MSEDEPILLVEILILLHLIADEGSMHNAIQKEVWEKIAVDDYNREEMIFFMAPSWFVQSAPPRSKQI